MKLTYFGQSCFLVEAGGARLLFDPFIRHNPLAQHVDVDAIEADYILLSHGHVDHVADAEEIGRRTGAELVGMTETLDFFKKKGLKANHTPNVGGKVTLPFGTVRVVVGVHSSSLPDGSYSGLAAGFVVESDGKTFYFAGDTGLTYDMKLLAHWYPRLDFALLPIGGYFTMDIHDALTCAEWAGTKTVVGMHYDSFPPIKIDHAAARAAAQQAGVQLLLPAVGETITL